MNKPVCQQCHSDTSVKLRRRINSNGSSTVYWYCLTCQKGAQRGEPGINYAEFVALLKPHHATINDLPVTVDYTQESEPCIICGARDTEYNHWLPQKFADDPDVKPDWPMWANIGAPLCRKHHMLWHRIVTPYLPGISVRP